MKKQYKALMLDLDGTTIPNDPNGMPSKKVIQAIAQAQEVLHVGAITGRIYPIAKDIFHSLSLTGPSIVSGGSKVIDAKTGKIIWEADIELEDIHIIIKLFKSMKISFLMEGFKEITGEDNLDELIKTKKIYGFAAKDLTHEQAEFILDALKSNPRINANKIVGWKKGTFWVQVTHSDASKHHGVLKVAELLGIETQEIIGVGDGYNDFPLLMACGLKIAMGNAVPELKAIADYVAPTVEEDGVVDVIKKFVL